MASLTSSPCFVNILFPILYTVTLTTIRFHNNSSDCKEANYLSFRLYNNIACCCITLSLIRSSKPVCFCFSTAACWYVCYTSIRFSARHRMFPVIVTLVLSLLMLTVGLELVLILLSNSPLARV